MTSPHHLLTAVVTGERRRVRWCSPKHRRRHGVAIPPVRLRLNLWVQVEQMLTELLGIGCKVGAVWTRFTFGHRSLLLGSRSLTEPSGCVLPKNTRIYRHLGLLPGQLDEPRPEVRCCDLDGRAAPCRAEVAFYTAQRGIGRHDRRRRRRSSNPGRHSHDCDTHRALAQFGIPGQVLPAFEETVSGSGLSHCLAASEMCGGYRQGAGRC
jgi:hypothetical protein